MKRGACQNRNRNLELYKIIGGEITKYKIPKRYEGRRGIWLIGYDGGDKAYSRDFSLLNQLREIIDKLPIGRMRCYIKIQDVISTLTENYRFRSNLFTCLTLTLPLGGT